ncbi:efflux RND transporter periplasmic adaptor subunit [Aridibaculum aurantiacum]|uniref:efflux RND transporter periplasmic adaptor subunit n=1 Tax=Aridibaculum aurantiacum TaxID=2810307 RepID=UPI001F611211|nr:efflux RND transporter periplasmic adaptor subunit [Aridibaculum aurantiacum]
MKKLFLIITILNLLASCGNKKTETVKEEEHHEEAPGTIVSLTEEQIKTAGIQLGTIELKNLQTSIKANGMLSVPNENKAFITSVNSGVIKTLLIHPGKYVKKGQVVATIVNPDVANLQQQLQTVNAQISLAEIEYKRQRELVAGDAAPLKNVQRVQTELATLRVTRNSLQKQLSAMGISASSVGRGNIITTLTITAPISGTVSNVIAQIGSNVDPSTPLAEIVNNSRLHLDLFVFEKDLPRLHANQTIHFTLTNNPGKEYDAQIYSIGTAFANETKTVPIHAVVMGDKTGLIEGMNITAVISIGTNVVPAVPTEAIVNSQGQDYIFVLTTAEEEHHEEGEKEEGHEEKEAGHKEGESHATTNFERIAVIKGATDVGYTEVKLLKDLPPQTKIITKGAFFALAKMTNTGGHEH